MPMTMTEKILARHSGKPSATPGDNIWIDTDILMTHDVCGPGTIGVFKQHFGKDAEGLGPREGRHHPRSLHLHRRQDGLQLHQRRYAAAIRQRAGPPYFYDVGGDKYKGVCHIALPEEGHTRPGEVLFGTDSHTCTASAFGEFATGIGNTDAGFILGTGKLWVKVPPTMRFVFHGDLPPYLMAKGPDPHRLHRRHRLRRRLPTRRWSSTATASSPSTSKNG